MNQVQPETLERPTTEKAQIAPDLPPGDVSGAPEHQTPPSEARVSPTGPKIRAKQDAQEFQTWGEKKYENFVYRFFGFGVNLALSSYLTYWVNHSNRHVPFTTTTPKESLVAIKSWLKDRTWLTGGKESVANAMGNALILTMGGHILIPVVKLCEDSKTKIVQWLDKKHYGEEGIKAPEIEAAHQRIAEEIRPTWLSTTITRLISMVAVQAAARTFGHEENFLRKAGTAMHIPGVQSFPGIDKGSEDLGAAIGKNLLPEIVTRHLDNALISSTKSDAIFQEKDRNKLDVVRKPSAMLLKYGVSDILYTFLTAKLVKPVNTWLIHTFPALRKEPEKTPTQEKPTVRSATFYDASAPAPAPATTENTSHPKPQVTTIQREGQIQQAPAQLELQHA